MDKRSINAVTSNIRIPKCGNGDEQISNFLLITD